MLEEFMPLIIIPMGMAFVLALVWMGTREKVATAKANAEPSQELQSQLDEVIQRLEALEAIVTDEDRELTRKLASLNAANNAA